MFKELSYLYLRGKIDITDLKRAVIKGWITKEQYFVITGREY